MMLKSFWTSLLEMSLYSRIELGDEGELPIGVDETHQG